MATLSTACKKGRWCRGLRRWCEADGYAHTAGRWGTQFMTILSGEAEVAMNARLLTAFAASVMLTSHVMAETDGLGRECYVEISASSQLFSLGSVRADHAVWMMEGDFVQRLSDFGHVLFGYWALSDFEKRSDSGHRAAVYESDPYLFYGYDCEFAEGWRLRNRFGMIWVFNEGYEQDVVHLIREWTNAGELKSPWVTLFGQTRLVDDRGTYVRCGFTRAFGVFDEMLSVAPHVALAGGSRRWNRSRYGSYPDAAPLSQGLNTVDYGVLVRLPLRLGASFFVDVCGCHAYDGDVRAQIRASRRRGTTRRMDAFFVTSGFSWEF